MKTLLKTIGFVGLLGCEIPDIGIDFAHRTPEVDKATPDTTITYNPDTIIVYNPDTIISPIDSINTPLDTIPIVIPDTTIVYNPDTIITQVPDTVIYTPINTDGNVYVKMNYKDYKVGDRFDYSFEISNLTNSELTFKNNKENRGINCKIFCDKEVMCNEVIEEDFTLTLKKNGYFGVKKRNSSIEIIASGVEAEFDRKYNVPLLIELSITTWALNSFFEKAGEYHAEFDVKYKKDGQTIESKFYSEKFKAEE
ncbi:hypothetical protein KAI04_03125 [Candidatus Pacearchaeota archaeon]|nr:hypothetical protein [Candidatus Pacearchaeota archaeon]